MLDASVIVSIVLAVISLLGTVVIAVIGHATSKKLAALNNELAEKLEEKREGRQDARELAALTAKYSQPLMVAAYELEARLYEMLEYPITIQNLEVQEGLEDINIFTCYKFAQFLAWTHILKSKTQYFSFSTDPNLKRIADLILRLNEEFDRRRDFNGQNVGVWPGYRLLVSERMIKSASHEKELPLDTIVKGYNEFRDDWNTQFKIPMGFFCQWIDDMLLGRKDREQHWDDPMRLTQHNLVDMIQYLDKNGMFPYLRRCKRADFCDCTHCPSKDRHKPLEYRGDSRNNDVGLRPWYVNDRVDREYDSEVTLEAVRKMTCFDVYNDKSYTRLG